MSAQRIQLRRTKGWRKPEGAVVVARPSKWGNPFTVRGAIESGFAQSEDDARTLCADAFASWLANPWSGWAWFDGEGLRERLLSDLHELAGRDLACWCPLDQPCHADVLLAMANKTTDKTAAPA